MVKENIAYHWKVVYFGTAMKNNHHDFFYIFSSTSNGKKKNLCKNQDNSCLSTKEVQLDLINQKFIGIFIARH